MDQVLVERSGTYELVDPSNLHAELVDNNHILSPAKAETKPEDENKTPVIPDLKQTEQSESVTNRLQVSDVTTPVTPLNSNTTPLPPSNDTTSLENGTTPVRPPSGSMKSSSQPLLHTDHYTMYERTATNRRVKRPMSAKVVRRATVSDKEAIEKREMADAAFDHWKRQKDREHIRKKREKKKEEEHKEAWTEKRGDRDRETKGDSEAFKSWLLNKSRQRSEQRQVEKIRAQIITSELLAVDYTEGELAYERWLKRKNQSKIIEKRERNRKSREDKEEMKEVLQNIKTRWNIDYKKSHYLHPNSIRGWDSSPLYSSSV